MFVLEKKPDPEAWEVIFWSSESTVASAKISVSLVMRQLLGNPLHEVYFPELDLASVFESKPCISRFVWVEHTRAVCLSGFEVILWVN